MIQKRKEEEKREERRRGPQLENLIDDLAAVSCQRNGFSYYKTHSTGVKYFSYINIFKMRYKTCRYGYAPTYMQTHIRTIVQMHCVYAFYTGTNEKKKKIRRNRIRVIFT